MNYMNSNRQQSTAEINKETERMSALAELLADVRIERNKAKQNYFSAVEYNAQLHKDLDTARASGSDAFEKYQKTYKELTNTQRELEELQEKYEELKKSLKEFTASYTKTCKQNKQQRKRIEALERALNKERSADA